MERRGATLIQVRKAAFAVVVCLSAIGLWIGAQAAPAPAAAPIRLGIYVDSTSVITTLQEKAPLKAYLSKALGREVQLVVLPTVSARVEGLGNGSVDFALLGGLAYIKAHAKYGAVPLVQRSSDLEFHTVFICRTESSIHNLADLKGKKFSFGDPESTAGHLMPEVEMRQAGVYADRDLQARFSANHPATAHAVESGEVEAGALDESVYESLVASGKIDDRKVRVFYTSKPYVDYVWVARKDLDSATQENFAKALLNLHAGTDDEVLQALHAKAYVRASNDSYNVLRLSAQILKML
jgi:phosphonate transport system substrate-binding protein